MPTYSQRAQRAVGKIIVTDFSGGLNDTNVATLINDNEAQTATNVFVNLRGGVEKRYGFVSYSAPLGTPTAGKSLSLITWAQTTAGISDKFLFSCNDVSQFMQENTIGATSTAWIYVYYTNGTATFTNSSATVTLSTGTAEWLTQINSGDLISADAGVTWYSLSSVDSNTQITLSTTFTGTTQTVAYRVRQSMSTLSKRGVMFNNNLYFGPGIVGTIHSYNGTSSKRITTVPANSRLHLFANFKNYLFAVSDISASDTNSGSRLYWSASLDATTWPSTNFVDVSPNDGSTINGLIVHNDVLYIFKDNSIFYLIGNTFDPSNPSYSLNRVVNPQNIGTSSGDSLAVFKDRIVFLGPDGIYSLTGINRIENISEHKIRTTIRSLYNLAGVSDLSNPPTAAAVVYDNRYWLSVSTGTTKYNDLTLIMEPNGSITRHSFSYGKYVIGKVATTSAGITFVRPSMSAADQSTSNVNFFDGTAANDGSTAITSTWTSKIFGFGDFSRTTHVYEVFVAYYNAASQAATLKVYDDSGQVGSSAAHTFPGGTTQFITVQKFTVDRDTNGLYLTVTDATAGSSFRIMGIEIVYEKDMAGSAKVVAT